MKIGIHRNVDLKNNKQPKLTIIPTIKLDSKDMNKLEMKKIM